ncbi:MAG: hypothetical protein ABIN01_01220 [Ferruginibacter sp.]
MFGFSRLYKKAPAKNAVHDKVAYAIVSKMLRLQTKWAAFMGLLFERLSVKTKKLVLTLFCCLAAACCGLNIIIAFSTKKHVNFSVTTIKVPRQITRSGEDKTNSAIMLSTQDYQKILVFKKYMDSLDHCPKGKKIGDSIRLKRPGLMDSILSLEELYQLQQSQKK